MQLSHRTRRKAGAIALAFGVALSTGLTLTAGTTAQATAELNQSADKKKKKKPADNPANASRKLRGATTPSGIREHLEELQAIAAANDRTRASGTPGYAASRDYIVRELRQAGYRPRVQAFDFPYFAENSPAQLAQVTPTPKTYVNGTDFASMTYSGSGDVTADVVPVDTTAQVVVPDDTDPDTPPTDGTSGCEDSDFASFPAGQIALMQRGTCPFADKRQNAEEAGAAAAIIMNRGSAGQEGVVQGTLGTPGDLPVLGTSFAVGQELYSADGSKTARVVTDTESDIRKTWNVTAETREGRDGNVVMAGAHLDSVGAGPGINDNSSGSATILEVAENMRKINPRNQVRFAWWGAEELGLLGSEHYVADLDENNPGALRDIRLYLNFDMVGSPNFARFVYDGDNSTFPPSANVAEGPPGSDNIERTFIRHFKRVGLSSDPTEFSGRSDYGPFIAEGVPSGGLFTGAEGVKTEAQAAEFGGVAGLSYDECYHQACDSIANVNMRAINQMSNAVAHSVAIYSYDTERLGDVRRKVALPKSSPRGGLHPASEDGHDHGVNQARR